MVACLVKSSLPLQSVVRIGVVLIDLERFVVAVNGFVQFFLSGQDISREILRVGEFGIDGKSLSVVDDGIAQFSFFAQNKS